MGTQSSFRNVPSLTIPNGANVSNSLPAQAIVSFVALMLYGPTAVDGGTTYKIEVNPDPLATPADTDWRTLVDAAGTDVECPTALKARLYTELAPAGAVRIKASANVGAERSWSVTGVMTL